MGQWFSKALRVVVLVFASAGTGMDEGSNSLLGAMGIQFIHTHDPPEVGIYTQNNFNVLGRLHLPRSSWRPGAHSTCLPSKQQLESADIDHFWFQKFQALATDWKWHPTADWSPLLQMGSL